MPDIKKKILRAALNQFLTYGKSGAKTKAIADLAGVNKALIHYYFSNKDKLFKACVNFILEHHGQLLYIYRFVLTISIKCT